MPGPCWWILLQGKMPTVKVGNTEMPIFPGRGLGWYYWYELLKKKEEEIKKLKEEIERLKREIRS